MSKMSKEILEKEFNLTDVGYSKNYIGLNNELIRVEFNTFDLIVALALDMNDISKYLSEEKYNEYEEQYRDEEGYGFFWKQYKEQDTYWKILIEYDNDKNLRISDESLEIFDKNILEQIKQDFIKIMY